MIISKQQRVLDRSEHEVYFTAPSLGRREQDVFLAVHHPLYHRSMAVDRQLVRIGTRRYWMLTVMHSRKPRLHERIYGLESFTASVIACHGKKRKGMWHRTGEYCGWDLDRENGEPVSLPVLDGSPPEGALPFIEQNPEQSGVKKNKTAPLFRIRLHRTATVCAMLLLIFGTTAALAAAEGFRDLHRGNTAVQNPACSVTGFDSAADHTGIKSSRQAVVFREILSILQEAGRSAAESKLHVESIELLSDQQFGVPENRSLVLSGSIPVAELEGWRNSLSRNGNFEVASQGISEGRFNIILLSTFLIMRGPLPLIPDAPGDLHSACEKLAAALFTDGNLYGFRLTSASGVTGGETELSLILESGSAALPLLFKLLIQRLEESGRDVYELRMRRQIDNNWLIEITLAEASESEFSFGDNTILSHLITDLFKDRLDRPVNESSAGQYTAGGLIHGRIYADQHKSGETYTAGSYAVQHNHAEVGRIISHGSKSVLFLRGERGQLYREAEEL